MRISKSAIGTGIIAKPIRPTKHVVITSWISNAGNVATTGADTIGVILVIASRAANNTLQHTVIIVPKSIGPRTGANTCVGERVAIE